MNRIHLASEERRIKEGFKVLRVERIMENQRDRVALVAFWEEIL